MTTIRAKLLVFAALTATFIGLVVWWPMGFLFATYENLYGEWLQFGAFFALAVFSALLVRRDGMRSSWFWLLLGLAAFYTAMEEISWGQQIFGWESSEFFEDNNIQGETNLHNMFTGPVSSLTKDVLTYVLALGIFGYGVVYPLVCRFVPALGAPIQSLGIPNPGLALTPFFFVAAICELSLFSFNEAELAELYVALALFFVALVSWRMGSNSASSKAYGGTVLLGFAALATFSFGMTQFSLHHELSRERVANRIEAGIKKFAGRYARVGAHGHAADLYARHAALKPESRSRLQRVVDARDKAGDASGRQQALEQILALDLARLTDEAWRASLHRRLYADYMALGDRAAAQKHGIEALRINRQRLIDHPNSAEAAYSAARTYDMLNRAEDALAQYRRAARLDPGSKKYRDAYAKARRNAPAQSDATAQAERPDATD